MSDGPDVSPDCPRKCAHCGEHVYRDNGFFPAFPVPAALHHGCAGPYHKERR